MQRGYRHAPVAIRGNLAMTEDCLPIVHRAPAARAHRSSRRAEDPQNGIAQ
jgi:hypothetical protein